MVWVVIIAYDFVPSTLYHHAKYWVKIDFVALLLLRHARITLKAQSYRRLNEFNITSERRYKNEIVSLYWILYETGECKPWEDIDFFLLFQHFLNSPFLWVIAFGLLARNTIFARSRHAEDKWRIKVKLILFISTWSKIAMFWCEFMHRLCLCGCAHCF